MHQDTKSVRLIAVCKRTYTLFDFNNSESAESIKNVIFTTTKECNNNLSFLTKGNH